MVLSLLFTIPVVELYRMKYTDYIERISKDLVFIFVMQTLIALIVLFNSELRDTVVLFQRQGEFASIADQFSGGIRGNFLSGPLFFGLSSIYALVILILFNEFVLGKVKFNIFFPVFLVLNVGLVLAGRAGFIYIIGIVLFVFINFNKPVVYIKLISVIMALLGLFAILNLFSEDLGPLIHVYNYAFEFVENYKSVGAIETSSTNELFEMYNLNLSFSDFIVGHGLYTNPDESYYMNTDVGYIRKLLYGGSVLLIYSVSFTLVILWPMLNSGKKNTMRLGFVFFILYTLLEFKGEAMLNLVSFNTVVFLIAYATSLKYFKRNSTRLIFLQKY